MRTLASLDLEGYEVYLSDALPSHLVALVDDDGVSSPIGLDAVAEDAVLLIPARLELETPADPLLAPQAQDESTGTELTAEADPLSEHV